MEVVKARREGDIGYVRLSVFNDDTDRDLRAALAGFRKSGGKLAGLVIDLRNNPGGLLDQAIAVADDFLNSGEIVSTRGRLSDDDHAWYAKPGDLGGGLPIVVLINNGSASASEIVAGALAGRSPRRAAGHPQLRQGLGADAVSAGQRRRDPADHRALLHAGRPLDPGRGHHPGCGGARIRHAGAELRAGA